MIIILSKILYTVQLIILYCNCLDVIDLPQDPNTYTVKEKMEFRASQMYEPYPRQTQSKGTRTPSRRYSLVDGEPVDKIYLKASNTYEDEKDVNLKSKISTLVEQTMHDTERRMKTVQALKDKYREQPPYRAGFVLSLVKKSKDVLNELFNVAVKHRDEWKALEQLKIFELIVHTNVDTTHLLRQLVDIHLAYVNTSLVSRDKKDSKRILII